jgi:uncharacterized protein
MSSRQTLFDFPCDYPLKVIGVCTDGFAQEILDIVIRHSGGSAEVDMRTSRKGKYLSISLVIQAQDIDQIDALYRELTTNPKVCFVL